MTQILSEVWKQTTPDSSIYLKDGVRRLVYALPDFVANRTHKKSGLVFYFGLSFRQWNNTDKL